MTEKLRLGKLVRWLRGPGRKGRFYRRSLIMILLVSGIPGLITGVLVYATAVGSLESDLNRMHNKQIEQRAQDMDEQLSNLELMLSHWAFDSKFDYSLNGHNFVKDFERTRDITKTLLVMQGSSTMIKRVELYLGDKQHLIFDPEYNVLDKADAAKLYDPLVASKHTTYWTQWSLNAAKPDDKALTLVHHIPGGSLQPFGALVVQLDRDKVGAMLRTMMPYNDGETYLMQTDSGGDLFVSASRHSPESPFITALNARIAASGQERDSFFFQWDGAMYTVSYGGFSRIASSWRYVSAAPISSITAPVVFASKMIVTISASALLLAAVLAWLASRSIYSPVRRMMHVLGEKAAPGERDDEFKLFERQWQQLHTQSNELYARLSEQLPRVRESFLHQLLQGYLYAYTEHDLRKMMTRYKWTVDDHRFFILYFRLSGMNDQDGKFRRGDEALVTFAAANLIGELADQHFSQGHAINFHDLTAGLLLIVPLGEDDRAGLTAYADDLTQTINRMLNMRVTIVIGEATERISDVPPAFEAAKQAAAYRDYANENQRIDLADWVVERRELHEVGYPFARERELIQAIRAGNASASQEHLEIFLDELAGHGAKEWDVQQGVMHLLGAIQRAVMQCGIHPNRLYNGTNLYEQLAQIRETKHMLAWFEETVIGPFLQEMSLRNDTHAKRLIDAAMLYLEQHYMQDVSLEQCAENVGTNPFYLSKSFKQVAGTNFIDYLTELRMEKAKELLRESEMKIQAIAEQVGYQHSYFNRIFKKLEGVTPSHYREQSRSS